MSPELQTLDQLLGGDMSLSVTRQLYPDDAAFVRGIHGLLAGGDVRLLRGAEVVPEWRWRQILCKENDFSSLRLQISDQGVTRIS